MAIFRFFKMAAAAILDFQNFKFLTVGLLKRVELLRQITTETNNPVDGLKGISFAEMEISGGVE